MLNEKPEYVVASLTPHPELYCFTDSADAAVKLASSISAQESRDYSAMTYAEYIEAERKHYQDGPCDALLGWFANAIEAGRNAGALQAHREIAALKMAMTELQGRYDDLSVHYSILKDTGGYGI